MKASESSHRRLQHLFAHLTAGQQPQVSYTVPGQGSWSNEEREQFARDGFLVVRGLLTQEEVAKYVARFRELSTNAAEIPPSTTVMRDVALAKTSTGKELNERSITKMQDFYDEPGLFSYATLEKILERVASVVGKDIMAIHTMFINKPPDLGQGTSRHPTHQDLHYFPYRPANRIVASWTALERIDRENGCLFVVPGSHRKFDLLPHDYDYSGKAENKNAAYHGVDETVYNESELEYLIMEPGDTVFFHPLLLHGSGVNYSTRYRKAISCHYASTNCDMIDVEGTSQQTIVDSVNEIARKKLSKFLLPGSDVSEIHVDYRDLWEAKSKVISS